MLITKEHKRFARNVKAIHGEFQHALEESDIDRKKIRSVARKTCSVRRKISLLKDVKAIPGEFQNALVIADIDKKKIRKEVIKTCADRLKISLLKDVKIKKRFEEKVITLVDDRAPNLWRHFKNGVLKAYDEECWKKRGRRSKGDTWCWNEEVKEAVSRKIEAHKAMRQNSTYEKKLRHKSTKNKAKKAVSKTMREKAEEALTH